MGFKLYEFLFVKNVSFPANGEFFRFEYQKHYGIQVSRLHMAIGCGHISNSLTQLSGSPTRVFTCV